MSQPSTEPLLLPLLGGPPSERRDAARNRKRLLDAAQALVESCGPRAMTMDAVAAAAGVGKGTVFRRFGSREGLMAAVLDHSETEWQAQVLSGPPPLGPGADAWDRLLAFGRTRLENTILHAELIREAGASSHAGGAQAFAATHVRYLLGQLGVTGNLAILATALLAPLELPIHEPRIDLQDFPVDRVYEGWVDLARRITRRP